MLFSSPDDSIVFKIVNPDAQEQDKDKAIVYIGIEATLDVTVTNNTGGPITLQNTDDKSTFELFMPGFFTAAQKQDMEITTSEPGWKFSKNPDYDSLKLEYTGTDGTVWPDKGSIKFKIIKAKSDAAPTIDSVIMNLSYFSGDNIMPGVDENLVLTKKGEQVNRDLSKVLQVNLDNQGSVFVSVKADPLTNTIFLNIKNIGANPLYDNKDGDWKGEPTVTVTFEYGNTAGSLAPDKKSDATIPGSAWLIGASTTDSQNWSYKNPIVTDNVNSPSWVLYPTQGNKTILGTGDKSNVTFAFSNINSFTPTGHTQMYVLFSNFPATPELNYNPMLLILDIVKLDPPPTRGLLNFFGTDMDGSVINLPKPTANIKIPLRWSMFYVDNIRLICNIAGVPVYVKDYYKKDQNPPVPALAYDTKDIVIPMKISQSVAVFLTLQAFNNEGGFLNSMQFTVFISANFLEDPNGEIYPTVFINNQTWLAANYNYLTTGAMPYDNNGNYRPKYGLLYTFHAAVINTPEGWRIPTQKDWQELIAFEGTDAYKRLMAGGDSGLNAQLGGSADNNDKSDGTLDSNGYYWSTTPDTKNPGSNHMIAFYKRPEPGKVNVLGSFPTTYHLSVRYVRNV